jgi:hypothetical protein
MGETDNDVRHLINTADERRKWKRTEAAQAAITRRERQVRRVDMFAEGIVAGEELSPRIQCRICGKKVTDKSSTDRGIGSDCWQALLAAISQLPAAR